MLAKRQAAQALLAATPAHGDIGPSRQVTEAERQQLSAMADRLLHSDPQKYLDFLQQLFKDGVIGSAEMQACLAASGVQQQQPAAPSAKIAHQRGEMGVAAPLAAPAVLAAVCSAGHPWRRHS